MGLLSFTACSDSGNPGGGGSSSSTSESSGPGGSSSSTSSGPIGCSPCTSPKKLEQPKNEDIDEASGLVASREHAGVLYVTNDSGDSARFFATDDSGKDLGVYNLTAVKNRDWEAISLGPCADPRASCLYIGDIGDNRQNRSDYAVHRVAEPNSVQSGLHSLTAETFRFRYPDGKHDAEALFVDPRDGKPYILTKTIRQAKLFSFPLPLDAKNEVELVFEGEAVIPDLVATVTAADMAPDAHGLLVRTYSSVWFFEVKEGETIAAALARTPCGYPTPNETQGETIAWQADNAGYRTLAEGKKEEITQISCSN